MFFDYMLGDLFCKLVNGIYKQKVKGENLSKYLSG